MLNKNLLKLSLALGMTQGCLHIKNMENFEKKGLIKSLEQIEKILTEILQEEEN